MPASRPDSYAFSREGVKTSHNDPTLETTTEPLAPMEEPDEPSDLESFDVSSPDDDARWDAFLADDDEVDPLPEPGDFWATQD